MGEEKLTLYIKQHFLFNSLNCAISLCRTNPNSASKLLIALSECLHYASNEKNETVILDEEVEFLKSYLYIQTTRFESRLRVEWCVDTDLNYSFKPFLLYNITEKILSKSLSEISGEINMKLEIKKINHQIQFSIYVNKNLMCMETIHI